MNETDAALFTKLTDASGLTALLSGGTASVFQHLAPQGDDVPYVVFGKQARTPRRVIGGGAVALENLLYTVKGVTAGAAKDNDPGDSAAPGGTIAAQIDTALDQQTLTVSGHTSLSVLRESDIDFVEPGPGGRKFYHRGAVYRIHLDPT